MQKRIYLCLAHTCGEEMKYIQEAFDTNWVVPLGPNVNEFERALEYYLNCGMQSKTVALASGTSAIHLALVALGVDKGDEVIVQSFTFCASANPVIYQGATPVFVDSELDTWNIDPQLLEKAIVDRMEKTGRKPKAIIPVTLYGMPYDVKSVMEISRKYDIPVIEDSAEGMGSAYEGKHLGTFGAFGVMSFNGNKMITTSGGGALIINPGCGMPVEEMKARVLYFATQARQPMPFYHHTEIGYNYRMSNICAGIGRGQMTVVESHVAHHKHVHNLYCQLLADVNGLEVKCVPDKAYDSNYWLTTITLDSCNPDTVIKKLDEAGAESRHLWKPLHMQPIFTGCPAYVNGVSEHLFKNGICLPSGPMVTDEDVTLIANTIKSTINE